MIFLKTSKQLIFLLLMLVTISVSAQSDKFNKLSAELTTGIHVPLAPNHGISRSKYIAFKQFQLSMRYMFNEKIGLKGHYAFNRFSNPDDSDMGVSYNRAGLEGVVNLGKLMNVSYLIRERFGLLFHAGAGITLAKPSMVNGNEKIGNLMAGFTGQIKLDNRFAILGDLTYVGNIKQHYAYNGELMHADFDSESGSFLNVSIGIVYYFGEEKYHADWY